MDKNILKESGQFASAGPVESKGEKKMNTSNALIAVVALLIIMAGVQVFQTQKLLEAVSTGAIKANAQTQGGSIGLPSQVGGCG